MYRSRFIDEVQVGKHGAGPHQLLIHLQYKQQGINLRLLQMKNGSYFIRILVLFTVRVYICCRIRCLFTSLLRTVTRPRQRDLLTEGGVGSFLVKNTYGKKSKGSCNAPGHGYTSQRPVLHLDESTVHELHLDLPRLVWTTGAFTALERVYTKVA